MQNSAQRPIPFSMLHHAGKCFEFRPNHPPLCTFFIISHLPFSETFLCPLLQTVLFSPLFILFPLNFHQTIFFPFQSFFTGFGNTNPPILLPPFLFSFLPVCLVFSKHMPTANRAFLYTFALLNIIPRFFFAFPRVSRVLCLVCLPVLWVCPRFPLPNCGLSVFSSFSSGL